MATLDQWKEAFIGAGANLGDRAATLRGAVERLARWPGVEVIGESSLYETEPLGKTDQPLFLNAVIAVATNLAPEQLLEALLTIEQDFGRVRTERWGPRTLDLDLLVFEGETRSTPNLVLPHPRLFERTFVLAPLDELLGETRFQRDIWRNLRGEIGRRPATGGVWRWTR